MRPTPGWLYAGGSCASMLRGTAVSIGAILSVLVLSSAGWSAHNSRADRILLAPIGGEKPLAGAVTRAIKANLRQSQMLEVTEFRPDLPTLKRAVLEKRLAGSDLDSTDAKSRQRVGAALEVDYVLFGDAKGSSGRIDLKMSAIQVSSGRQTDFEASMSTAPGIGQDTLVLSAANTVVSKFMQQVLGLVPPAEPAVIPGGLGLPHDPVTGSSSGTGDNPSTTNPSAEPSTGENAPKGEQPGDTHPTPASPALSQREALPVRPGPDTAAYTTQAESLAASGDLAGAIQAMRTAVNLSPDNVDLRLKLAEYYERKGMNEEASSERQRAMKLAPGEAGSQHEIAAQLEASGSDDDAERVYRTILDASPKDIKARIALGDVLWNKGKVDDAGLEYAQAASDAPSDPAPQERLARLFASRGQFLEATSSLATSKMLRGQDDDHPVEPGLYRSLLQSSDIAYNKELTALSSAATAFRKGEITREDYYNKIRALVTEVEQLVDFLSDLDPPDNYAKSHLYRTLAASLLAQSVTATQEWLLKNEAAQKEQAEQFQRESQIQMDSASQLERRVRAGP